MKTRYGIISDVHQDPRIVTPVIQTLIGRGAERLILNGDIGNEQGFIAYILNEAGKSGLETYVQPGSHEKIGDFDSVMKHFGDRYSNLINALDNQKISNNGHELVFLPGSDWLCGGEYLLVEDSDIKNGIYNIPEGIRRLVNMNDLETLATEPDKIIVICHIPRRFDNLDQCVDMARFGFTEEGFDEYFLENEKGDHVTVIKNYGSNHEEFLEQTRSKKLKILDRYVIQNGSILPLPAAVAYKENGANIDIKTENRGNEYLKSLYEKLGIRKAVSGHFHESGHRANDRQGNHVNEGELVDELFWNSGHCDAGQIGILTVEDNRIAYENVSVV